MSVEDHEILYRIKWDRSDDELVRAALGNKLVEYNVAKYAKYAYLTKEDITFFKLSLPSLTVLWVEL